MKRTVTTGLVILLAPVAIAAQGWNSPRADSLAAHATSVRAAQLADSGLKSYKAEAMGYLTFLAQLGKGFPTPPKIVRADQIASDIYWKAPSFSKQLIKGRRDTLVMPTDINYHRDHLGIVQNNFPSIIRIGDGDEVEDALDAAAATLTGQARDWVMAAQDALDQGDLFNARAALENAIGLGVSNQVGGTNQPAAQP